MKLLSKMKNNIFSFYSDLLDYLNLELANGIPKFGDIDISIKICNSKISLIRFSKSDTIKPDEIIHDSIVIDHVAEILEKIIETDFT
jgi:hypothetical protein